MHGILDVLPLFAMPLDFFWIKKEKEDKENEKYKRKRKERIENFRS